MQELETITIKEYLNRKGITYCERGTELVADCIFNDCDKDSGGEEAHLYFSKETGQHQCKKCGESGNIFTLAKHFGDAISDIAINGRQPRIKNAKENSFSQDLVDKCHNALPAEIRKYLNDRGIKNECIDAHKIGWGRFYNKWWITIPIKDQSGVYSYFKLREDPTSGDKKISYPEGIEAQLYGRESLDGNPERIIICEGELDQLALASCDVPAVTSTHGALTFKQEWCSYFAKETEVFVCYDNDDAGKKGSKRVVEMLHNQGIKTNLIILPKDVGEGGDITDYLVNLKANPIDLFEKYAEVYPLKIDVSKFKALSALELSEILGLTIKRDVENKVVTFLCELSAYTDNAQFNISYNAPSSTGKSYIPTEIAKLFPKEDVLELAYCSPTAFFHDIGEWDKANKSYLVDLSQKILIFLDQPHTQLLERLRPLLSHDKKEITVKITDKSQKYGLKTKNVLLRGYPSVIFCTAGLRIDEQEATRFLLLSPEINQEKLRQGIHESLRKEADVDSYKGWLNEDTDRKLLKERILAIRQEAIKEIKISNSAEVEARFFEKNKILKPRHQRDIKRLTSLIKSFALLNLWWREKDGSTIVANDSDIEEAFAIWEIISASQELNLPPYIFSLYEDVILGAWKEKNECRRADFEELTGKQGLTRQEILQKHFDTYGRMLDTTMLRQQILPMLETAGLIVQDTDPVDKRKMLVFPLEMLKNDKTTQINSVTEGGVNIPDALL